MLRLATGTRVFVSTAPTDMRKSFDGLYALTQSVLEQDPLSGHLFVFVNRKRDYAKVLYFERGGLCLWAKRLEQGRFALFLGSVPSIEHFIYFSFSDIQITIGRFVEHAKRITYRAHGVITCLLCEGHALFAVFKL